MRIWRAIVVMAALLSASSAALAAVPTRDQAILNQRTETSTVKVRLLDTTKKTDTNTRGIRCATTTGQRGTTRDTTQPVTPNGGDARVRQFDPGVQRAPDTTSSPPSNPPINPGRNAQQRAFMDGTSTVVGGVDVTAAIIPDTQAQYRQLGQGVGTAPTVMGALDQNSAVRIQNGITWNQTTQSTNLLVQALNTASLFNVGQLSTSAGGMATGLPVPSPTGSGMCAAGFVGRGTTDDPCRPANTVCSTTPPGVAPDPACVSQRYIDRSGNVAVYLGGVQDASLTELLSAPATSVAPPVSSQPTAADITAALQSYR
ncbi:hypothetical protein [Novosphingobium sp.]|uniref:hypothetical protein n=1 Tax=Novosphingobium sp. TaxID=1874826 RepID=UPI001DBD2995|nr:hypothetical protein [Novosphingobium sp.]MBX9664401.1 hypothetical protein [Novosphingobium sp.]